MSVFIIFYIFSQYFISYKNKDMFRKVTKNSNFVEKIYEDYVSSQTYSFYIYQIAKSSLTLQPHGPLQVPLSTEFTKQEYWSGLPFPSPGNLSDPGIKLVFPALQAFSSIEGRFFPMERPRKSIHQAVYISFILLFDMS